MGDYYKFGCDFYYLHYDMNDKFHGTIYRHYSDTHKIEYIHGSNDEQIFELDDANAKKKIFLDDLTKLKTCLNSIDNIEKKSTNTYLNMYDYNSFDYENYYKKISLAYLCNDDNICALVDIDMKEIIINIGMFFTFIETNKFKMNEIYIKNKNRSGKTSTKKTIFFNDYLKSKSKSKSKSTGGMRSYPGITEVISEQEFIYYETLDYYQKTPQNNLMPVIIEYDIYKGQFIIVDGNHRVAYHIKNKFEYIPVIIIFKNLTIDI